jgi:plastocyanin
MPPLMAAAEIHEVTIKDNYFSPNDLHIAVGDTVRWTYTAPVGGGCGYYGCEDPGTTHTVTADDGSFTSGAPSSNFTYEHQFFTAGEYRYYCAQHSRPGRAIDSNMNGRITVDAAAAVFPINAGLNDAWYNPATAGQGFFITVFPDIQMMFLAWFTYDTERPPADVGAILGEPGHRWLTAFGPYSGDTAMLDVELTRGGVFDAAEPAVTQSPDGTIDVVFSGCNAGMINYDITSAGVSGQVPIERIALDNVPRCETLANPQ